MAGSEAKERLAYCARCRRVVPTGGGRRGKCPGCGRALPAPREDVMTKVRSDSGRG